MHSLSRWCLSVLLVALGSASPSSVFACSCISTKESAQTVRAWAREVLAYPGNVVLLKAKNVEAVGDSHERAELEVVASWKGAYAVGTIVRSDTMNIGGGMCDMSISVGELYLAIFREEPIAINGCPTDGGITKLERKYLDKYARLRPNKSLRSPPSSSK